MAKSEHLALLEQGVKAWNDWREAHQELRPDLSGCVLSGKDLSGINLSRANLRGAGLYSIVLDKADLSGADLLEAKLRGSKFRGADLRGARLMATDLNVANFNNANLEYADLSASVIIGTFLEEANLSGCNVYGISVWDVFLDGATQLNLVITAPGVPEIQVDNLEVAQFIHLLLNNQRIRDVIDTITSKVVLILGRFTPERKAVLDALRDELRERNRTPIVFDFLEPRSKNTIDTIKLLGQMARYIIIDLSDPNSALFELGVISMLGLKTTPVVPIIQSNLKAFSMLDDVLEERWSTDLITYRDLNDLRAFLDGKLVSTAEAKVLELRGPQPG